MEESNSKRNRRCCHIYDIGQNDLKHTNGGVRIVNQIESKLDTNRIYSVRVVIREEEVIVGKLEGETRWSLLGHPGPSTEKGSCTSILQFSHKQHQPNLFQTTI